MSEFASIDAVELLRELRRQLVQFAEGAKMGVAEADADVSRTLRWLEMEQQPLWEQRYRKRQDQVKEAMELLRKKTLYKAVDGTAQSAVDERKAVQRARAALEEAEAKRKVIKAWRIKLEQEALLYRGLVQPVLRAVDGDIPAALERLDRMHDALDRYVSQRAPTAGRQAATIAPAGDAASPTDGGPSMARPELEAQADASGGASPDDGEDSSNPSETTP